MDVFPVATTAQKPGLPVMTVTKCRHFPFLQCPSSLVRTTAVSMAKQTFQSICPLHRFSMIVQRCDCYHYYNVAAPKPQTRFPNLPLNLPCGGAGFTRSRFAGSFLYRLSGQGQRSLRLHSTTVKRSVAVVTIALYLRAASRHGR